MTHKRTPMVCATSWLVRSCVGLVIALLGLYAYSSFLEKPFLSYLGQPFVVLNQPVTPGKSLSIAVFRCNANGRIRQYVNSRELHNVDTGEVYVLPSHVVEARPGCERFVSKLTTVPTTAPPGQYVVIGASHVDGLMRTHVVRWRSEEFEVVKHE